MSASQRRWEGYLVLIDYLEHLIKLGGLAEPVNGGMIQYREFYALPTLEAWVDGLLIPDDHGQAEPIARSIIARLSKLYELAIDDGVGERICEMISRLLDDYVPVSTVSDSEPVAREGTAFTANWVDSGNPRIVTEEVDPDNLEIIEPDKAESAKKPPERLRSFFDPGFAHPVPDSD